MFLYKKVLTHTLLQDKEQKISLELSFKRYMRKINKIYKKTLYI